jgi:gas vesicle protein
MKNRTRVFSALVVTVLLATWSASFATSKTDATTRAEVSKEVMDAIAAIKDYTADQRDEAVARTKTLLEDIDTRIEQLEARINERWEHMSESGRNAARAKLKALRQKRDAVAEWYGRLQHSTDRAWDHIKAGLSEAYSDLRDAWENAADEFDAKD